MPTADTSLSAFLLQNAKCALADSLGLPLRSLVGNLLTDVLAATGAAPACTTSANLLRVNITTASDISVGLLTLYADADGAIKLALRLNQNYVLHVGAKVLVQGSVLGIPLDLALPVDVKDGELVSCVVATVTTAVPGVGCLLAGLDPKVNLDLPLKVALTDGLYGTTGLLPGLVGSTLHALGINLNVTAHVVLATVYQDASCTADYGKMHPLTVQLLLGRPKPVAYAPVAPTCETCPVSGLPAALHHDGLLHDCCHILIRHKTCCMPHQNKTSNSPAATRASVQ